MSISARFETQPTSWNVHALQKHQRSWKTKHHGTSNVGIVGREIFSYSVCTNLWIHYLALICVQPLWRVLWWCQIVSAQIHTTMTVCQGWSRWIGTLYFLCTLIVSLHHRMTNKAENKNYRCGAEWHLVMGLTSLFHSWLSWVVKWWNNEIVQGVIWAVIVIIFLNKLC